MAPTRIARAMVLPTILSVRVVATSMCAVLVLAALISCGSCGDFGKMPAHARTPILLFDGTGASPGDVAAVRSVLSSQFLEYSTVDSRQLNEMSQTQIGEYRLLIVPGGNFVKIGNSLTANTTANIRTAIRNGSNYLGICAGAFFAGDSPYNGLNLTSGLRFEFYEAEARGIHKAALAIAVARGQTLDQYWEDGPQLSGWGVVVGKYPDGTPAIVEGTFGNGRVILTGVHPEAPESWRRGMGFRTPADIDNAYAATLIRASLNREWLPHY